MARSGQAEGFIVLYSRTHDPIVEYLSGEGLLYVLIGKAYHNANQTIYVDNDNVLAGKEAASYLIRMGHQRIAYISPDNSLLFAEDRKTGYTAALLEHQLPVRPEYCIEMNCPPGKRSAMLKELLSSPGRPTAVLVSDDILAMFVAGACGGLRLSVPGDLSILSFNNSLFAQLSYPQLTSVDVNARQLGIEAAAQMISHIENPGLPATKIIVPHVMVERDSCAPPASA